MRVRDDQKVVLLYNAIIELVDEIGLPNISLSKLSERAGIPKANIYTYFKSKEEMINSLYLMAKEKTAATIFEGISSSVDVKSGIFLFMRNSIKYLRANPHISSFLEQCASSPIIRQEIKRYAMQYYMPAQELYERGRNEKYIKAYEPALIKIFVYGAIVNLVECEINHELVIDEKIISQTLEMVWEAIKYE